MILAGDPSLAMVMGVGASVSLAAHEVAKRRPAPLLQAKYDYPTHCEFGTTGSGSILDPRLLSGAALFGIGWGLLGICPGPSVVGLAGPFVAGSGPGVVWRFPVFVLASLVAMQAAERALPAEPAPAMI